MLVKVVSSTYKSEPCSLHSPLPEGESMSTVPWPHWKAPWASGQIPVTLTCLTRLPSTIRGSILPVVDGRDEPPRSAQHTRRSHLLQVWNRCLCGTLWNTDILRAAKLDTWYEWLYLYDCVRASSPPTALSDSISWWHVLIALLKIALDVSTLATFSAFPSWTLKFCC